jgi:pyruvate formate lyase activating enzyme
MEQEALDEIRAHGTIARIRQLLDCYNSNRPEVFAERAVLATQAYAATEDQPMLLRRSPESLRACGRLLAVIGTIQEVSLLPYHRFGQGKYDRLGKEYPMGDTPALSEEHLADLLDFLTCFGLKVKLGG